MTRVTGWTLAISLTLGAIPVSLGAQHHGMTMAQGMPRMEKPVAPVKVALHAKDRQVVISAGPYQIPPMDMDMEAAMSEMSMGGGHEEHGEFILTTFPWPVPGFIRGFRFALYDKHGKQLPQPLMHHLEVVNLDRRQLVYPMAERILGMGEETAAIMLPKSVGIPMEQGMQVRIFTMWNNTTGAVLDSVSLRLTLYYSSMNLAPRPLATFPFKVDVNSNPGRPDSYEVPVGGGTRVSEFTVPISGRLLGAGGHLHDHARELRLEDVGSGKVLARVRAIRGPDGKVTGVGRSLFGVRGRGVRLVAGRPYRLVARYDNPTGEPLHGVMGVFGGLFAPDRPEAWPAIDKANPDYLRDLAVGGIASATVLALGSK